MTKDQDFKALVRARMARTGQSYTAARKTLLDQRPQPNAADAPRSGFGCGKCGAPVTDVEDYRRHLEEKHGKEPTPIESEPVPEERDGNAAWTHRIIQFLHGDAAALKARTARAQLAAHLEQRYDVEVARLRRLDGGAFRVDLADGRSWVARLFPDARPLTEIEADVAVLRYVEEQGYPAERCAHPEPVSAIDGQGVLVTDYIEGTLAEHTPDTMHALGDLLGRLHGLPADARTSRSAGALHIWSPGGGPASENLAAARRWLTGAARLVPERDRQHYEALIERVDTADDCGRLPEVFIHPDLQPGNAIATPDGGLTIIDWAGAGRGPRLLPLTMLLWLGVSRSPSGDDLELIDPAVAAYRQHVEVDAEELDRMAAVMRAGAAVLDSFYFAIAIRTLPDIAAAWPAQDALADAVANRARKAFAT